jgi:hypothetical protein
MRREDFDGPPRDAKSSVSRTISRILSGARFFVTKNRTYQKSATYVQKPTLAGRPDGDQVASILSIRSNFKSRNFSPKLFFSASSGLAQI